METGKNYSTNILRAYQRYLKLQRNYSANTIDAYKHDIKCLLDYSLRIGKNVLQLQLED